MMEIGHNLLDHIQYLHNVHGAMFFTESSKDNENIAFKYKINLPKYCDCAMCIKT